MKKQTGFEIAYDSLLKMESRPKTEESISNLRLFLNGRVSLLASKSADIAAEWGCSELIPDMIAAFDYYIVDGAKVDKLCNAKISIVNALNKLEYLGDEVFLRGAYYTQIEPAFGKPIDTAILLRCSCAFGLARTDHSDISIVLTDLLLDKESEVRVAAVKALTYVAHPESEYLLRLKILAGDNDPDVIGECFNGLMAMSPERSLDFVVRYLQSDDPSVLQYAALALGGSRLSKAYDKLREYWDDFPSPVTRRMLLLPIALTRNTEAFEFILEILKNADVKTAIESIYALRLYQSDDNTKRIGKIVHQKNDAQLTKIFNSEFGY
jgi:hypothetical protein